MDLKELLKPFPAKDIEWRIGRCGESNGKVWATCLAYITARAVFERLDEVCGPENWSITYQHLNNGVVARLAVKCGTEWVTKEDGAEYTDIETFKGGMSGAIKRAASVWGIGRYLYDLTEGFAQIVDRGNDARYAKTKEGKAFYWLPPELPDWALPPRQTKAASKPKIEPKTNVVPLPQKAVLHMDLIAQHKIRLGSLSGKMVCEVNIEEAKNYFNRYIQALKNNYSVSEEAKEDFEAIKSYFALELEQQ